MQSALDQFRMSIGRVRALISIYSLAGNQSTPVTDVSDLLRAVFVLAVSAMDYYIHEVVTLGMLEIHRGQRPEPAPSRNSNQSAYSRFRVSLEGARQEKLIATDISSWLEAEIQQSQGAAFLQQSHTISSLLPILSTSITSKLNTSS